MLDGRGIDGGQLEAFHDPIDLGCVLGAHHDVHQPVRRRLFPAQGAVDHAVAFGLHGKLLQMFLRECKDLQLFPGFQHGGQPLPPCGLGFVPVLQNGIERGGDVLRSGAGQPQGNLRTLQT